MNPPPSPTTSAKLLLSGATLCFAVASGLACLLSWHALTGKGRVPGCGGAADCGSLAATRWAFWGPVPVALPAVVLYAGASDLLLMLDRLSTGSRAAAAREGAV